LRAPRLVVAQIVRQHLQHDAALEPRVVGEVRHAHAAGAEAADDAIGPEGRAVDRG
jgi:hypothetical protein